MLCASCALPVKIARKKGESLPLYFDKRGGAMFEKNVFLSLITVGTRPPSWISEDSKSCFPRTMHL